MITYAYITAGSEATGGAGIQVDPRTSHQLGVYDMGTLTRTISVDPEGDFNHRLVPIAPKLIHDQIEAALGIRDIDTVKVGMLGMPETVGVIEEGFKDQEWKNVVLDPVLIYKGRRLGTSTGEALRAKILPFAAVATPNYFEACILAGMEEPETIEDMTEAARRTSALGPKHVVVKGDVDFPGPDAVDLFWGGERATVFIEPKVGEYKVSGAGCMLAAATTAGFTRSVTIEDAVRVAEDMVTAAIKGRIPTRTTHDWARQGAYRS